MNKFITRTIKIALLPKGEPLFSIHCTNISIEDEAAGEFVVVEQQDDAGEGDQKIKIAPEEWPALRDAIDKMIAECHTAITP